MNKPVNRLGRGLSALIPPARQPGSTADAPAASGDPTSGLVESADRAPSRATPLDHAPAPAHGQVVLVPLDRISPNPLQPRTIFNDDSLRELADSIRSNGVLQPVLVRRASSDTYELVAGERRWRAAQLAGLDAIPAIEREINTRQAFELALVENLQREDLGALERAAAYQHYLDTFGGTTEDLAARLGESRANIANYLRLLKLQPELCFMLGRGELSMGQARALAGVADSERQLALAKLTASRNLSVRQVEALVRRAESVPTADPSADRAAAAAGEQRHLDELARAFSKALGTRVRIRRGRSKNSGTILIPYATIEEFDRIAQQVGAKTFLE
ncbi:MAG: ParB/RepB/Spo0J family partition protein [Phycisphaerales bacterium]|nr:ParB/RepB/Spo0J family partition protein [Phycisphaerales bacterium]